MVGSDLQLDSLSNSLPNSTNETVVDRLLSCLVPLSNPVEMGVSGLEGEWEKDAMWRVEEEKNRAQSKAVEPFLTEELAKLGLLRDDTEEEEEEEEEETNIQPKKEEEMNIQPKEEEEKKKNAECAQLWMEIAKLKEERKDLFRGIKEKCFEQMRVEKRRRELESRDRRVMQRWEESNKRVHYNGWSV